MPFARTVSHGCDTRLLDVITNEENGGGDDDDEGVDTVAHFGDSCRRMVMIAHPKATLAP